MFRFHVKCMLQRMIIEQCFAARQVKTNACPAIVNFAAGRPVFPNGCLKVVLISV